MRINGGSATRMGAGHLPGVCDPRSGLSCGSAINGPSSPTSPRARCRLRRRPCRRGSLALPCKGTDPPAWRHCSPPPNVARLREASPRHADGDAQGIGLRRHHFAFLRRRGDRSGAADQSRRCHANEYGWDRQTLHVFDVAANRNGGFTGLRPSNDLQPAATHCFRVSVTRKATIGNGADRELTAKIGSVLLRHQPLAEGRPWLLLVIMVIGHSRALRIVGPPIAPCRCSCNVLANQSGSRLAMGMPLAATRH